MIRDSFVMEVNPGGFYNWTSDDLDLDLLKEELQRALVLYELSRV